MKTKEIEIAGNKLLLFERRAKDVLDLADFLKSSSNDWTATSNMFVGAQVILASLRPNFNNLKWYQFFEKRKLKRIISYEFLILNLSVGELEELMNMVYELEGIDTKKKVVPEAESKSAEV